MVVNKVRATGSNRKVILLTRCSELKPIPQNAQQSIGSAVLATIEQTDKNFEIVGEVQGSVAF